MHIPKTIYEFETHLTLEQIQHNIGTKTAYREFVSDTNPYRNALPTFFPILADTSLVNNRLKIIIKNGNGLAVGFDGELTPVSQGYILRGSVSSSVVFVPLIIPAMVINFGVAMLFIGMVIMFFVLLQAETNKYEEIILGYITIILETEKIKKSTLTQ